MLRIRTYDCEEIKINFMRKSVSAPHTHRDTSRFMLDLQAIVALKELVKFPVISDPSHASFWAPWVPNLTYASVASGCDGLIIETHPDQKFCGRSSPTFKFYRI